MPASKGKVLQHQPRKCPGCDREKGQINAGWRPRWQVCDGCVKYIRYHLTRQMLDPEHLTRYRERLRTQQARLGYITDHRARLLKLIS